MDNKKFMREIFEGGYSGALTTNSNRSESKEASKRIEEAREKMDKCFLDKKDIKVFQEACDEWVSSWFKFTDEEMFDQFLKGVQLGFNVAIAGKSSIDDKV